MWFSFHSMKKSYVLLNKIRWPGQTKEFLALTPSRQMENLVHLVSQDLSYLRLLPVELAQIGQKEQHHRFAFNEWVAFVNAILHQ